MMQTYTENDTVQNLYDEIEHLIDIPFEKYSPTTTTTNYETKDFHYKEYHNYELEQKEEREPLAELNNAKERSNSYSFERPILIESDSDDIEEELLTPQCDNNIPVCFKCDRPIQSSNTLNINNNICQECSSSKKKSRSRSSSFTFSQLTDKLKQSFGHSTSSSNQLLLDPTQQTVDRRKSMPTMNSIFNNELMPPVSPVPSRPSSRASSFIEDVKQFLNPLSRKSSRNSMHSDYLVQPEIKRKSSHQSLLDVINICKPKLKQSPSYEKRVIQDESWTQEDQEVMGVHQQEGYFNQDHHQEQQDIHVPLRRKQIKSIESRQDRIDIYNNAFFDCMRVETNLVPWIIKQTQKGPPDAWFGYTPPEREPRKIMGIFKRKSKADNISLRVQQQQLGDELLNRSTPLLQHRYSNSNLSLSPSNHSFSYSPEEQEVVSSPGGYEEEEQEEYFEEEERYMLPTHRAHEATRSPSVIQPVSILKKTSSNVNLKRDYYQEEQQVVEYDNDEEDYYYPQQQQEERYTPRQQQRRPSNDYYLHHNMIHTRDANYSTSPRGPHPMYMMEPSPPPMPTATRSRERRKSNAHSYHRSDYQPTRDDDYYDDDDYHYRSQHHHSSSGRTSRQHYEEPIGETYYSDSIAMKKSNSRRRCSSYYDDADVQQQQHQQHQQNYYGLSVKMTPYMMEEWEAALDDLCELYPRLDRHYINDFLRSAQGDFVTAKDMIMEMIMEVR